MGGGAAIQLPVSSTSTAPDAPRVASTAPHTAVHQLAGGYDDWLWITVGDSGFQRLRGVAEHAGELLGIRLDQVGGGSVEGGDERRERALRGVDRDPARIRREQRDHLGVPMVGHTGRQRTGQHHPLRGLGARGH